MIYFTVDQVCERWQLKSADAFRRTWLKKFTGVKRIGREYLIPLSSVQEIERRHSISPAPSVACNPEIKISQDKILSRG